RRPDSPRHRRRALTAARGRRPPLTATRLRLARRGRGLVACAARVMVHRAVRHAERPVAQAAGDVTLVTRPGPCPQQALDKAQQLITVGCGQAVQLRLDRLAAVADPSAGNSLASEADAERDLTPAHAGARGEPGDDFAGGAVAEVEQFDRRR